MFLIHGNFQCLSMLSKWTVPNITVTDAEYIGTILVGRQY